MKKPILALLTLSLCGCVPYPKPTKAVKLPVVEGVFYSDTDIAVRTNLGEFVAERKRTIPNVAPYKTTNDVEYWPAKELKKKSFREKDFSGAVAIEWDMYPNNTIILDVRKFDQRIKEHTDRIIEGNKRWSTPRNIMIFPEAEKAQLIRIPTGHPYFRANTYSYLFYDPQYPDRFEILIITYESVDYTKFRTGLYPDPFKGVH